MLRMRSNDIFRLLAEPTRRSVLDLLRHGDRNATEIAAHFDVSQQAVSLHLQELRKAGVVKVVRTGRFRRYGLKAKPIREVYEWAARFRPYFDPYGHAWLMSPPPHAARSALPSKAKAPRRGRWS